MKLHELPLTCVNCVNPRKHAVHAVLRTNTQFMHLHAPSRGVTL